MSHHDPNQDSNLEKLIQAICWKLGLENDNDSDELRNEWQNFADLHNHQEKITKISTELSNIWKEFFDSKLNSQNKDSTNNPNIEAIESLWKNWFKMCGIDSQKLKTSVQNAIRQVLVQKSPELPDFAPPPAIVNPQFNSDITASQSSTAPFLETSVSRSTEDLKKSSNNLSTDHENTANRVSENPDATEIGNTTKKTDSQIDETFQNHAVPQHQTAGLVDSPTQEAPSSEVTQQQLTQTEAISTPIIPPWQYRPVPDEDKEPKPHDEFYSKSHQSPEGFKLIGARVRGKMHKHQGTNCDDWFEFDTVGKWTIIAVSDGAGSKKFSRIGAKISCQEAVKSLKNSLKSFSLDSRQIKTDLENDLSRQDGIFKGEDVKELQKFLYKALNEAYKAVENRASYLKNYPPYNKAAGKKELDTKDLSSTLLLAIHTKIRVERENFSYDFVLTCQIGDGMLAAISHEYTLKLLGKPDIGEHGGQTDFLTSARKLESSNLVQKTFPFIGNLKALMIMTDGVSDDYFPNDPGMLELYGDLILNRVLNIPDVDKKESEKELQKTNLKTQDDVRNNRKNFQDEVERILASSSEEPKKFFIRSIAKYAERLGKKIKEVLTSPGLLNAGILEHQMCQECEPMEPDEKLKIWLDSYYRKGSFDDRTLVVLYREEK